MTDTTPLTDFIESFKRSLRSYGWSEDRINSIKMETWTDGEHIRATINFRGELDRSRLSIPRSSDFEIGEAANRD